MDVHGASALLSTSSNLTNDYIVAGNEMSSDAQKQQIEIKMKENVAYEVPPSRIKVTKNEAYDCLPKANQP